MDLKWVVIFSSDSREDFDRLDPTVRQNVFAKIEWLASHFHEIRPLPLSNILRGYFKLRIGDLRVIYVANSNSNVIEIHSIGPRDKIYKRFGVKA